ncbi:MAG: hypothetical protein KAI77_05125 [Gammaproteobacteria bacterium]|nr:hypothetical protein [Gammaproteobacteria bacterium]
MRATRTALTDALAQRATSVSTSPIDGGVQRGSAIVCSGRDAQLTWDTRVSARWSNSFPG